MGEEIRKVPITYRVLDEDIDDIMVSCLEGGCTSYWCDEVAVVGEYLGEYASDQISRGGKLLFLPKWLDDEVDGPRTLDRESFLKGLDMYISDYAFLHYGLRLIDETGRVDPGEIDAFIADCIVQLALFGDVIYG